jgi:hypothetical protein
MIDYSSSDREVIKFLFSGSDWCDLYELHKRFNLSPAQILDIVERLKTVGLAEIDGVRARLTPDGRMWVIAARDEIFFGNGDQDWKHYNQAAAYKSLDTVEPYLPDLRIIDRNFFLNLALDKRQKDDNN